MEPPPLASSATSSVSSASSVSVVSSTSGVSVASATSEASAASAVAVILAFPAATPVIIPSLLTVATLVAFEENVTFLTFVSIGA